MTKLTVTKQLIDEAAKNLEGIAKNTSLRYVPRLSDLYDAEIYLKREDLQPVRSFKIRGAYNKMLLLKDEEKKKGVVCASAGNHAQGVAWSCTYLKIKGVIFMPSITPNQKISKVRKFAGDYAEIRLIGETFDDAFAASKKYEEETGATYIHAFNDPLTIAGQGTVGKEIYEGMKENVDVVISCVGGGGLLAGVATYLKESDSSIRVFGSEPEGAAAMFQSLKHDKVMILPEIDTFVDGAALKSVGELSFQLTKRNAERIVLIPEGKICSDMISLYQEEGIIAEPAGTLAVSALEQLKDEIKGKRVVAIISGGNNDIMRYPEVLERSLVYEGLKHYFIIEFAQKPGQLKVFLEDVIGKDDDIVLFEYMKKNNKEKGPALVGIELTRKEDLEPLVKRMKQAGIQHRKITPDDMIYNHLI